MTRALPWLAVVVLIGTALAVGLQGKSRRTPDFAAMSAADDRRATDLLADRDRPWWNGHRLPTPASYTITYGPPARMGSWPEPPVGCPVMPVELARSLMSGRAASLPKDHPLA